MDQSKIITDSLLRKGTAILDLDGSLSVMSEYFKPYGIKNTERNREMFCSLFLNSPICPVISAVILDAISLFHVSPEKEAITFLNRLETRGIIPIGNFVVNKATGEPLADGSSVISLKTRNISCIKLTIVVHSKMTRDELIVAFHVMVPVILEAQRNCMAVVCEFTLDEKDDLAAMDDVEEMLQLAFKTFKCVQDFKLIDLSTVIMSIPPVTCGSSITRRPDKKTVASKTLNVIRNYIPKQAAAVFITTAGLLSEESLTVVDEIVKMNDTGKFVSGIFGKSILNVPLSLWKGNDTYIDDARELFSEALIRIQDFFD